MAVRALARVNLAAIERNVAPAARRADAGAALCAVVKATATATERPRRHAALAGGARVAGGRAADEAAELRGGGIEGPRARHGRASSAKELRRPRSRRGGRRRLGRAEFVDARARRAAARGCACTSSSTPAWGGSGRATATRRRRRGAAPPAPAVELAGAMTHFATADEAPIVLRRAARALEPCVAALRERWPGTGRARGEQRRDAARAARATSTRPLRGRDLRPATRSNEDPAEHGLEPALELTSYVAAVKLRAPGESAGYGAASSRRGDVDRHVPIGYGDGVRRGADEQLRHAHRRPALPAGRHGQHGQHHGRPRAGAGAVGVGDRRPHRRDGRERRPPRRWRAGSARSTTRSGAESGARVPRDYHRDGAAVERQCSLEALPVAGERHGSSAGGARRILGRPTDDHDIAVAATCRGGTALAGVDAHPVRAVGDVRRLARGRPRSQLAGRRAPRGRAIDRGRPGRATSPSTRSPNRSAAANTSILRRGSRSAPRTLRMVVAARVHRRPSAGRCASRASRASWSSRSIRDRLGGRGKRARAARRAERVFAELGAS